MKNRLIIASLALVAVGALAIKATRSHQAATVIDAPAVTVPKVKKEDINGLEISIPGRPAYKLVKSGEQWNLTAPLATKADQDTVGGILESLSDLKITGVAATRKENHKRLQVSPELAIHVKAEGQGKPLLDLYVGAAKVGGTMIRPEGSDTTLIVSSVFRQAFDRELKLFRNRVVTDVDSAEVTSLNVESEKGRFRFDRDAAGTGWKQAAGEKPIAEFDAGKVQSLANTFTHLRATDFAADNANPESLGFTAPRAKLVFTKKDGAVVELLLGSESNGQAHLRVSGDPVTYRVTGSVATLMMPDAKAFVAEKAPPPEPTAAAGGSAAPPSHGENGGLPPELLEQIKQMQQAQGGGH